MNMCFQYNFMAVTDGQWGVHCSGTTVHVEGKLYPERQ